MGGSHGLDKNKPFNKKSCAVGVVTGISTGLALF